MPSKLFILIKVQSVVNNYDEKHAHLLQLAPQIIVYGETVSSILWILCLFFSIFKTCLQPEVSVSCLNAESRPQPQLKFTGTERKSR